MLKTRRLPVSVEELLHQIIAEQAQYHHQSISGFVRQVMLTHLITEGVLTKQDLQMLLNTQLRIVPSTIAQEAASAN